MGREFPAPASFSTAFKQFAFVAYYICEFDFLIPALSSVYLFFLSLFCLSLLSISLLSISFSISLLSISFSIFVFSISVLIYHLFFLF